MSTETFAVTPEELEERIVQWFEGYEKLKKHKATKAEAQFFLGCISGLIQTLEALGYNDWEETMLQTLNQPNPEVSEALNAADKWFGRRVMRAR